MVSNDEPILSIIDDDGYHNFIDSGIADMYRGKGVRCSLAIVACRAEKTTGITTSNDPYYALSWDELKQLEKDGFEILNHSYSHNRNVFPKYSTASKYSFVKEYQKAQKLFIKNGFNPKTIVYPWGNPKVFGKNIAGKYFEYGVLYCDKNEYINFKYFDYKNIPRSTAVSFEKIKSQIDYCATNNTLMILGTHSFGTGPQPSLEKSL